MTEPRTYLIADSDDLHYFEVFKTGDLIYIHTNGRNPFKGGAGTSGLSPSMATDLRNALSAVLSGQFDRAVSETFLRIEVEREQRALRNENRFESTPPTSLKPGLDQL